MAEQTESTQQDGPRFVNMKTHPVTVHDPHNRLFQVHPYQYRHMTDGTFVVEGNHYRQFQRMGMLSRMPEVVDDDEGEQTSPPQEQPAPEDLEQHQSLTPALQDEFDKSVVHNDLDDGEQQQLRRVLLAAQRGRDIPSDVPTKIIRVARSILPSIPDPDAGTDSSESEEGEGSESGSEEPESEVEEPESEEDVEEETDYDEWRKEQLLDYARSLGLSVNTKMNREEIIATIKDHESSA